MAANLDVSRLCLRRPDRCRRGSSHAHAPATNGGAPTIARSASPGPSLPRTPSKIVVRLALLPHSSSERQQAGRTRQRAGSSPHPSSCAWPAPPPRQRSPPPLPSPPGSPRRPCLGARRDKGWAEDQRANARHGVSSRREVSAVCLNGNGVQSASSTRPTTQRQRTQDARGHALGEERLQSLHLLSCAHKLDGTAADLSHGGGGASNQLQTKFTNSRQGLVAKEAPRMALRWQEPDDHTRRCAHPMPRLPAACRPHAARTLTTACAKLPACCCLTSCQALCTTHCLPR